MKYLAKGILTDTVTSEIRREFDVQKLRGQLAGSIASALKVLAKAVMTQGVFRDFTEHQIDTLAGDFTSKRFDIVAARREMASGKGVARATVYRALDR